MRPKKTGLDYFPFDVDFFEDEKTVCVAGEFGIKGELTVIKLLCAIYRNGYFIEWSEAVKMKMLRQMPGISSELFDQILNRLVRWGFFDASLFDSVKVLTSVGIQRRYFEIVKRRKIDGNLPYLLVNVAETRVNVAETGVNVCNNPQSKVNKSKLKKISPDGDIQKSTTRELSLFAEEDKKAKKQKPKVQKESGTPTPTLEEVLQYFLSQDADKRLENWEESAKKFFDNFNSVEWRDKYNRRITRWDSRANLWIMTDEKRQKEKQISDGIKQTDKFSERRGTEPSTTNRKGFKGTL